MKFNPAELYDAAHRAGNAAVANAQIIPMIVTGRANPLDDTSEIKEQYFVDDGVCGFASVIIKPANSRMANYIKQTRRTYKNYYGGLSMPVSEFNQSLQKKEAYAGAFAEVLRAAGIEAYVDSRMD